MITLKYINTNRGTATAEFIQVDPSSDGSFVRFDVKSALPSIGGVITPMVKVSVFLSRPSPVNNPCDPTACSGSVSQTARVELNLKKGNATDYAAMKAEVIRVLDEAIAQNYLLDGVVPPVTATFTE